LAILEQRDDVQLVIVGDGPARQRLERELPKAKFVGLQSGENLARYYASLDVFVHTGKHETFCQSIQEALASGVPVIAPNSGGPTDLVKHGWTGFLIDTQNSHSLNHTLNLVLKISEPTLMSERARNSVIERTWDLVNAQLINHYRELKALNAKNESDLVA
jgi:phosphatidylinositol alpha 1,6-mannosyltransferase